MAYDPTTGMWKPEDDSVANNLTGLLDKNSDYIKTNRQQGLTSANRRGLLNSTMGAEAGQSAAINAALPIAQQDASQTTQKNLSAQGYTQQYGLQKQQITAASEQQAKDIAAQEARLQEQLSASKAQYEAEIAAGREQQAAQAKAQMEQLQAQLTAQREQSAASIASNEKIAALDAQTKANLAQLDKSTQLTIANMNVQSNAQDKAMAAAVSYAQINAQELSAIMQNENIPAETRNAYIQQSRSRLNTGMNLVEQMYNVKLDWGQVQQSAGIPASSASYNNPVVSTNVGAGARDFGGIGGRIPNLSGINRL